MLHRGVLYMLRIYRAVLHRGVLYMLRIYRAVLWPFRAYLWRTGLWPDVRMTGLMCNKADVMRELSRLRLYQSPRASWTMILSRLQEEASREDLLREKLCIEGPPSDSSWVTK